MTIDWFNGFVDYSGNVLGKLVTESTKYVAVFTGAFALSLLFTPLARQVLIRAGMLDLPDARRVHKRPTPRGGGVALFAAFHLTLGVLAWLLGGRLDTLFNYQWQCNFFWASGFLLIVGLIDDKNGIKPLVKLGAQLTAALILYNAGVRLGGIFIAFPAWLDCILTLLWIVTIVNAFNFIDGMDGLATGLALIASIGMTGSLLFMGKSSATLPFLALAGASLGFLRYNFYPASIFLGDAGSMFLGLCIATMPLVTGTRKELVASLGVPLLALGVPLFDTVIAVWRRTIRARLPRSALDAGQRARGVMQPDKDHLHHRLLRVNMSQRRVAMFLYGISAVLVFVGLGGMLLEHRSPGLFMIAFIVAVFVMVRHLERIELWDTGRLIVQKRSTLRKGILMPLYITWDIFALCLAWCLARWEADLSFGRFALLRELPLYIVPVFLMLVLTRTYWRVWSRAQVREFALLGVAVFTGAGIGTGLAWLFDDVVVDLTRFALVFPTFAIFPLVAVRIWRDSISGILQSVERRMLMERNNVTRVLVYGGGLRFRSLLREMAERPGQNERVIAGVIDDDIHLWGRIMAGYLVVGGGEEMERFIKEYRVNAIIITCDLDAEKLASVIQIAQTAQIPVTQWCYREETICPGV